MSRILIAEDNAVNRELLRELLEVRGHEIAEASDGAEALELIERVRPDILLLDIGMPEMDGFTVLRKVRENPQMAALPVLAVTAFAMRGDRERVLNSGFDGYLSKPVDFRLLIEEVNRLLSKRSVKCASSDTSGHASDMAQTRAENS